MEEVVLNSEPGITWCNEPGPKETTGSRATGWTLRGICFARGAMGYGLCAEANDHAGLAYPAWRVGMDQCGMRVHPHLAPASATLRETPSLAPGLLAVVCGHAQLAATGGSCHTIRAA